MGPIRVGLIGLSGTPPDQHEGLSWTPKAHLPYLKTSPDYEIVALLNSSVEPAQSSNSALWTSDDDKSLREP